MGLVPPPGGGGCSKLMSLPPVPSLAGSAPPRLPATSAPRRVPTMPVVGVLFCATLLTLGWRATHAKDHGFATPRVQLSFKGKSLAVGVGGGQGGTPRRWRRPEAPWYRLLLLLALGAVSRLHPQKPLWGIHVLGWLSSQSAPPPPPLPVWGLVPCPVPPVCLSSQVGGWVASSIWGSWVLRCGEPPQQCPEPRHQLDATQTPPAGINAWELAGSW